MEKRVIRLDNGLEALLICDPLLNKASCALDVAVGSLDDPKEYPGTAHLLEHMFFMGTQKYPRKGAFQEHVLSNQGAYNASTGLEHTNYRFEIDHGAFEGALDRFSQFFISPVLKPSHIEAEKKVISSEFSRNKEDPSLREQRIFYLTCREGHAVTRFHHGNARTLKNITRKVLHQFFCSSYSPGRMKLVVLSRFDLQSMEAMIREYFSPISSCAALPRASAPLFDREKLPQRIQVRSSAGNTLKLCFEAASLYSLYRSKPGWILNFLLNTTRTGSLAHGLKEQGLISELWSSTNSLSFTGFVFVDMVLTEKGARNTGLVMEKFFAYVNMLREKGYPRYIYEEQKAIADMGFRFKEHREGLNVVKDLARNMHYYPALEAEECNDLLYEYDVEAFNFLLGCLRPEAMKVFVFLPNIGSGKTASRCKRDHHYGIDYSVSRLSRPVVSRLNSASDNCFRYPERNVLVPGDFKLNDDDPDPYPHKIMDDKRGVIWFVQSRNQLPLSYVNLLILTKTVNADPGSKLLSLVYARLVEDLLNDVSDMAGDAGLSFGIERDDRGIAVFLVGYSDKILELTRMITRMLPLPGASCGDERLKASFKRACERLRADYQRLRNASSYDIAQYEKHHLTHKNSIHYSEYVSLLDTMGLKDLLAFVPKIYREISIESYSYGSVSPAELTGLADFIFSSLNSEAIPVPERPKDVIALYTPGMPLLHNARSCSNDHCWSSYFEFGPRSLRLSAVIQLGFVLLESFFFDRIRNRKQIGYVVETRLDFFEDMLGISFTVLSDRYRPDRIEREAESVIKGFLSYLEKLDDEDLLDSKRALMNKIGKTNRTLEECMSEVVLTAAVKGDPQYGSKLSAQVLQLSVDDIVTVFRAAFGKKTRACVSVRVRGKD